MSSSTSFPRPTDLPPVTLLQQEIQSVTSSMRRNQRWASTASSAFASSSAPLPPYLHAKRGKTGRNVSRGKGRGSGEGVDEGDLMLGFVELRRSLTGVKDVTTLDPLTLIAPFLALIRSPLTSGPITSLALTSLHSLTLSILPLYLTQPPLPSTASTTPTPATPLQLSLMAITSTLSSCRFPSSSPQQDELVLLRLLRAIEALTVPISGGSGWSMIDHMTDESVCELLEVGLGMLARARLGEGLRGMAQGVVQGMVRRAFARLKGMEPGEGDGQAESSAAIAGRRGSKVEVEVGKELGAEKEKEVEGTTKEVSDAAASPTKGEPESRPKAADEVDAEADEPILFAPYGLPTILELLRVLIALLNPSDQAHTDSMRLSALAILNTALETGGSSLGKWPELLEGVRDEGCRYLFQLTRADSPALLAQSLRTTTTLFATLLPYHKLQLELFLSYLIDRLTPPTPPPIQAIQNLTPRSRPSTPSVEGALNELPQSNGLDTPTAPSTPRPYNALPPVPGETRELMLETLTQISARDGFMVDCWVNFDCETESEDMFERLVAFLTRGVYPTGPPKQDGSSTLFEGLENTQLLSLEMLLSFISSMAERLDHGDQPLPPSYPSPDDLTTRKSRKSLLLQGASLFNQKPKRGIEFLEKEGLIFPDPLPPNAPDDGEEGKEKRRLRAIARFLRSSTRLDKKLLGEYISRPDQVALLREFIEGFDFHGKSIADAMRELLETFRLPGESQPISRITETFAEHFFSFKPPEIASQDAVYVLAYSVIMLNTDQHNPQNRKRMTIEDYRRNLRGVNDGKDFDPEYLAGIHESIKKSEIILPEEHAGQHGFDWAWKVLMGRSRSAGPFVMCNTALFDASMFRISWRPLVSSIAYAFTMSASDEYVIQRSIAGFRQCASLASHFSLPEVFDAIVQSLSSATGLLDTESPDSPASSNFPSVQKDGQTLVVSPLSIRFGQSYRQQLATVVLFGIASGNAGAIRDCWTQIFEVLQTLFLHSLLPARMMAMEDFLSGTSMIPMKPTASAADRRDGTGGSAGSGGSGGGGGGGLLSTLSSYLLSPYGGSSDALVTETSEDEVEATLVAADCIGSCKLEEVYGEILSLEPPALIPALKALRTLVESRTTAKLGQRSEINRETGSPVRGAARDGAVGYDPAGVFLLEVMVSLAGRRKEHIAETWPIVFEYVETLLSSAQSYSVLLIERAVVGLLKLCLIISESPSLHDQLYLALDVLRSLPSSVLAAVSEQLITGIARILERDPSVVRSQTEWGLVIALFRATVAHPEASKVTLEIVRRMAEGGASSSGGGGGGKAPGLGEGNYGGVVALLDEFATAAGGAAAGRSQDRRRNGGQSPSLGPSVERGLSALDSLYELRNVIPTLIAESGMSAQDAWNAFWLPPLLVISKHCVNTCRDIRQRATSYLQRLLLSPSLLTSSSADKGHTTEFAHLSTIFDRVLFPVLDELLKPQVYERDPRGMAETRLKAATLLCKVFLQYVVRLVEEGSGGVGTLFVKVLDKLERFMRGERDLLNEAGESLKNVILVMNSSNLLLPPPHAGAPDDRTQEQKDLWGESAARIERILPGFLGEAVIPAQAPASPNAQIKEGAKA